jgi:RecA-family ATPase
VDISLNRNEPAREEPANSYVPPGETVLDGSAQPTRDVPGMPPTIVLNPFIWRDPTKLPRRQWLYDKHYIRQFVSGTVAPGGVGKTSLSHVEVLAMVTGCPLLGVPVKKPLKVWLWNGEDPLDEIERRITAAMLHYEIPGEQVEGRLFINSGRDSPFTIARKIKDGLEINEPIIENLAREFREKEIDLAIFDPFVSSHGVPENDNGAIDAVLKKLAALAGMTNSAIDIVHHVRKPSNGQSEFTIDDARGAVSLIGAARSVRVLNPMTQQEADAAGASKNRHSYFRVNDGKANMAPPDGKSGVAPHRLSSAR